MQHYGSKRAFETIDELEAAVGTVLGTSDWIQVDQQRINTFAEATDDRQWIHVDPERAVCGPYGSTIAHGFLTLSLIVPLTSDFLQLKVADVKLNYGLDRVRFLTPVPSGSRVRATTRLVSVDRTEKGIRTKQEIHIEIEGVDQPACVAETLGMLLLNVSDGA